MDPLGQEAERSALSQLKEQHGLLQQTRPQGKPGVTWAGGISLPSAVASATGGGGPKEPVCSCYCQSRRPDPGRTQWGDSDSVVPMASVHML